MTDNTMRIRRVGLVRDVKRVPWGTKTELVLKKRLTQKQLGRARANSRAVFVYRFSYRSGGHMVTGYLVEPRGTKKLPCVVYNRGGSRDFGEIKLGNLFLQLADIARWGYVVIASQYSENDGSEGKDEHGGKDLEDVLNLQKVLRGYPRADHSRIGMYGGSRGGMMTYMTLARVSWVRVAVVIAGSANLFRSQKLRPEMKSLYKEMFGGSAVELKKRSAVYWPEKFNKKTPLLMMHGSADWRVSPLDSLDLAAKLYEHNVPYRLVLFEGADHGLSEVSETALDMTRNWFEKYLKNKKTPLPNLKPHGR